MKLKFLLLIIYFLYIPSVYCKDDFDDDAIQYANSNVCKTVKDPLKKINEKFLYFNGAIDYIALYPTAKIYDRFTISPVKKAIDNFLLNLDKPYSAANSVLQGKMGSALETFWSFLINSTLGLGGISDIASEIGIKSESQNFGNTLAYYGAGPGPYLVLPVLGVMTARDLPDKILRTFLEPVELISSDLNLLVFIMNNVNTRAKFLSMNDYISSTSLDPYVSIRSMYIQKRENEVTYPKTFRCKN
jgi:phospholipid-binding lipoprotein MlaA